MRELVTIDVLKSGLAWSLFLHIKVNIDISTKPLMRGRFPSDDDDFQFGSWLCSTTSKIGQRKENVNTTTEARDEEGNEITATEEESL